MRLPFVSRDRYDELKTAHDALTVKYEALLAANAKPAPKPAKPLRDPLVDKLAADLGGVLTEPGAARAEAERIRREAFGP